MDDKKWEEILQACDAAKHRCLLTNPNSSYMKGADGILFDTIYSEAIRGRDWSIYNDETLQVLKELHIDGNLLDSMAEDVLLEALDKWSQMIGEEETRIVVQKVIIMMRKEMNLALQEQEKKLSAEKAKAVQKAVQEKVQELAAKGAALEVSKQPDASEPKKGRHSGRSVFDGKEVHPDIKSDSQQQNITVNRRSFKLTRTRDWDIADRFLSAVKSGLYATKEGVYDIGLTSDEYNGLSPDGKSFVKYCLDREKLKRQKQGLKYTGRARIKPSLLRPNV